MTYTRHGHHIPGTTTEDEPVDHLVARCGGVQICQECYWEWRSHKKNPIEKEQVMAEELTIGANATGAGKLTVAKLRELISGIPDNAVLTIHAGNDQRDGDFWSLSAQWGPSDAPKNSGFFPGVHPRGARIGDSERSAREYHDRMQP